MEREREPVDKRETQNFIKRKKRIKVRKEENAKKS